MSKEKETINRIEVGDRLTFYKNDKERAIVLVMTNSDQQFYERNFKDDYDNLVKIERIGQNGWYTVYEKKEDILTENEKEYLGNLIKPFKNKVKFIEKAKSILLSSLPLQKEQHEFIFIKIEESEDIELPKFKENIMYKGMELYKKYSLKELGLE